jgi:hypothetical protein
MKACLDYDREQIIAMDIGAQVEGISRTVQKITQCGPSYFAFLKFIFLNEAANETNYTVFRVECLSYNEEFRKLY